MGNDEEGEITNMHSQTVITHACTYACMKLVMHPCHIVTITSHTSRTHFCTVTHKALTVHRPLPPSCSRHKCSRRREVDVAPCTMQITVRVNYSLYGCGTALLLAAESLEYVQLWNSAVISCRVRRMHVLKELVTTAYWHHCAD